MRVVVYCAWVDEELFVAAVAAVERPRIPILPRCYYYIVDDERESERAAGGSGTH
jgi:hypothetical protein